MISRGSAFRTGGRVCDAVKDLYLLSESRGREASGFAVCGDSEINVYKSAYSARKLVTTEEFKSRFPRKKACYPLTYFGHTRLVTSGYEHFNENNQPFIKRDIVGIHNGIVVNIDALWQKYPEEKKETDLDSEILPVIIRNSMHHGMDPVNAFGELYSQIHGMTSIALFMAEYDNLFLATNNGSLYYIDHPELFVFASEYFILDTFAGTNIQSAENSHAIVHLEPGTGLSIDLALKSRSVFRLTGAQPRVTNSVLREKPFRISEITSKAERYPGRKNVRICAGLSRQAEQVPARFIEHYEKVKEKIEKITRCKKCLLPETFPFITFDGDGVCDQCASYTKLKVKGPDALREELQKYRRTGDRPDCIVAFSGGRDSSYCLHYVKKELGLTPVAYSYDWGMITDLARRNQARMCGSLGIEHLLVSADIGYKRANIRRNVSAWLKKPHLGAVPLFMAGDKHYFHVAEKLKRQNNIPLLIMGQNHFEKTGFKVEFCGARQQRGGYMAYHMSNMNKLTMMLFYGSQYLKNPSYLNLSLLDTFGAFLSYYSLEHCYLNLYDYIPWNEKEIEDILFSEYNWETEPGYPSTWRIGDGTAPFYNYIYYLTAGFSENDTLRSNQIREGVISREDALRKSETENRPRWDAIRWYLETIGLDFTETIETINRMPKLYKYE